MHVLDLSGSVPALITPFARGKVDRNNLARLVEWHIEQGSSGLVVCGTTGEGPTLSHEEHSQIVADAVATARGRITIVAGAGSNSTQEAIALSQACENAGADALLHVTGYYNKPTQRQVIEHFKAIDRVSKLPILVYNIPSRTGMELTVDTMEALAQLEHVAGVKDSTGNVGRVTLERRKIAKPFAFLSGDDATCLGYVAHGGHGCISVTANVAPKLCADMMEAALRGDLTRARAINDQLMPLHMALFLEPSPGGIKYAMSKLDLCANELRLPLSPVTEVACAAIDSALEIAGLCAAVSTH